MMNIQRQLLAVVEAFLSQFALWSVLRNEKRLHEAINRQPDQHVFVYHFCVTQSLLVLLSPSRLWFLMQDSMYALLDERMNE